MRAGWRRLALALCLPIGVIEAQSSESTAPTYSVAGTIYGGDHGIVAEASVEILAGQDIVRRLRSDTSGKFLATGLSTRAVSVRVRRVGFQPKTVAVTIPANEQRATLEIKLEESPAELAATNVVASDDIPGQRLREFYDRRATNKLGTYLDPDDIAQRRVTFTSELLRNVPGVRLRSVASGNAVTIRGCSPVIWLDGTRMLHAELDDVVQPGDVAAIEVYRDFAGVPAQYFTRTATCGTILVWTKVQ